MSAELELSGQAALVSGGGTQISAAIAAALAARGVRVCLSGRMAGALAPAAAQIAAAGGECLALAGELDSLEQAEALALRAREAFGRLDILVLVAGMWGGAPLHEHSLKTWDLVLAANLREPFLLARAVLPLLRASGGGQVVGIGSDSGLGIYPREGAFAVAMHGFNTLLELIRAENAEQGIRTHLLCPGLALTAAPEVEPALTPADVADWTLWALTRPAHLRGSGPVQI